MQVHFWVVLENSIWLLPMSSHRWQYTVTANSAGPRHVRVCSLSHTCIPLQLCHAYKHSLHSADPLQDPGLGYKMSLLAWVRIKPKIIAKPLSSPHGAPVPISFPNPSPCLFGVSSREAATGAAVGALLYVCSAGFSLRHVGRRRRGAFTRAAFPHLWPFHTSVQTFVRWRFLL